MSYMLAPSGWLDAKLNYGHKGRWRWCRSSAARTTARHALPCCHFDDDNDKGKEGTINPLFHEGSFSICKIPLTFSRALHVSFAVPTDTSSYQSSVDSYFVGFWLIRPWFNGLHLTTAVTFSPLVTLMLAKPIFSTTHKLIPGTSLLEDCRHHHHHHHQACRQRWDTHANCPRAP